MSSGLNQKHFTEQFLYLDGPFLPNSFKTFFSRYVEGYRSRATMRKFDGRSGKHVECLVPKKLRMSPSQIVSERMF
jgi:hypothetical protein